MAALAVGGWFLARAEWPGLSSGKAAIAFLFADIVPAPPTLFFVLRHKAWRKREDEYAAYRTGQRPGNDKQHLDRQRAR